MGLDPNGLRVLLLARSLGADFTSTMMVGRQQLHLSEADVVRSFAEFGMGGQCAGSGGVVTRGGYAEGLLRRLGARTTDSVDFSDYERCTHVHDMSSPIPDTLRRRYSTVWDSGSLEHVFNFPVAMANCMEMVQTGGHFITITPANNFMGHGFYQLSPELFFSALTPANGFSIVCVLLFRDAPRAKWLLVRDPAAVRSRIRLLSNWPLYVAVVASRTNDLRPFSAMPQQSDYVRQWNADGPSAGRRPFRLAGVIERTLQRVNRVAPELVKWGAIERLRYGAWDRRLFLRVSPGDVTPALLGALSGAGPHLPERPNRSRNPGVRGDL